MLRVSISLFVGIYEVQYLEPERYGLQSYALIFVWLFSSMTSFGLNHILVRELVRLPNQLHNLIETVFWLKICGTVVVRITIAAVLQFR